MHRHILSLGLLAVLGAAVSSAQPKEFQALQAHFERVVSHRHATLFEGVKSVPQWEVRKEAGRRALERMLWGDFRWPAAPPPAKIARRERRAHYELENIVLETAPNVYLTANLYLPLTGAKPFPVILYQCGHANKSFYARHGAWFAANGIAVLVMDNIEMGEIQITHHGVYSHAWFHWYSRGFSPLAVELLNARRALDYLVTRADIDRERIGATGRSGGGMTTFFLAAVDERVKASAPVSGTLSTLGWVKKQLSSAHCDCQYPVNTHGMLYSEVGALIAPRKQLHANADADRGFPMDAFNEMIEKMREVYALYDAQEALRTAVAPGGHQDTEAIRLPVYSFFLKEFLGTEAPVAAEGAVDIPPAGDLLCFREGYPLEERLSRIDEELIPPRALPLEALPAAARRKRIAELAGQLREEVFRYFPAKAAALEPEWGPPAVLQGRSVREVRFTSFDGLRVRGLYSLPEPAPKRRLPAVLVVDHRRGIPVWGNEQQLERNAWGERAVLIVETIDIGSRALEQNLRSFSDDDPRHHMKRQAMVAGTTLESMQVYEVLRSLEFLRSLPHVDAARVTVAGKGEAGVNGMYAALLDGKVERVVLNSPPASHRQGPAYLGILRYTDIPEVIALMQGGMKLYGEIPPAVGRYLDKAAVRASLSECLR
jgi:cephalosporin-C deacetylase-like acetyl esterase